MRVLFLQTKRISGGGNGKICIDHSVVYYPVGNSRTSTLQISKPKTEAGVRTIPMLDVVYDAFQMVQEEQDEKGTCDPEIDGMKGFVFINRYGEVQTPQSVNRTIKRIICSHNSEEVVKAKRDGASQSFLRIFLVII